MYLPLAAVVTACVVAAYWLGDILVRRAAESAGTRKLLGGVAGDGGGLVRRRRAGLADVRAERGLPRRDFHLAGYGQQAPRNHARINNLGMAYLEAGHSDKAIRCFNRAIELKPDFFDACNNRGAAFARIDRIVEAVRDFNKAIALKPAYGRSLQRPRRCRLIRRPVRSRSGRLRQGHRPEARTRPPPITPAASLTRRPTASRRSLTTTTRLSPWSRPTPRRTITAARLSAPTVSLRLSRTTARRWRSNPATPKLLRTAGISTCERKLRAGHRHCDKAIKLMPEPSRLTSTARPAIRKSGGTIDGAGRRADVPEDGRRPPANSSRRCCGPQGGRNKMKPETASKAWSAPGGGSSCRPRPRGRYAPGLHSGDAGRFLLGRLHLPRAQPADPGAGRPPPNLVHDGGGGILPAHVHHALGRVAALGRSSRGAARGQRAAPRGERGIALAGAAAARGSGRVAGGHALRRSPGGRGLGRLDHGAQEHALHGAFCARSWCTFSSRECECEEERGGAKDHRRRRPFRPPAFCILTYVSSHRSCSRWRCWQDLRRHAAGRPAAVRLVAAGKGSPERTSCAACRSSRCRWRWGW